jgi:hypothetical protein
VISTRISIPLGAHEVQYCALLAERRNVVKDPHGVRNQRHHGRSDFETHLIGVLGEYAAAKHFGVKVDAAVSLSGDDKVSDLIIDGMRVQVKTRLPQRPPLYLYFNALALFRADRAVCACVTSPATVELVGWMGKDEFTKQAEPVDFGYGVRYAVPEDALHDMGEWK